MASRGHHADIGGITPGSMPPHSTSILEEGAVFKSFKLVEGGVFQEKGEEEEINDSSTIFCNASNFANLSLEVIVCG